MRNALWLALAGMAIALIAADRPKPGPPKSPLEAALERLHRGNYAEALQAFETLQTAPETRTLAILGIVQAHSETGEYEAALKTLADAIQSQSQPEFHAARAHILTTLGQFDEAKQHIHTTLATDENNISARWTQACIQKETGDLGAAMDSIKWLVKHYTNRSNADNDITDAAELTIIAHAGAENARWNKVSKQFSFILNEVITDALKANPNYWPAEVLAGSMLLEKYNRPDAVDAFNKALAINPKCADALAGKAQAELQKYDYKSADQFVTRALKVNPRHLPSLRVKAAIYIAEADWTNAQLHLDAALKINPRDSQTLALTATIALLQREPHTAEKIIAQASEYNRAPGEFYTTLANELDHHRRYSLAEKYYRLASEHRPDLSEPKTNLGLLKLRMGDEPGGRAILVDALKADPFNVRVANTLKVLRHIEGYETIDSPHFMLKYDPKKDLLLAQFMAEYLEETYTELAKQFQFEPPGKITVELYSNHEMFSGRMVGVPDLHTVGACSGRLFAMASPSAKGVKKPFNWARVVRHELTHIFNLSQSDFACPHWITEGLAVGNERIPRPREWSAALRDAHEQNSLFSLDNITYGFIRPETNAQHALAYAQSQLYVNYVVEKYGDAAINGLLNAYRDGADNVAALKAVCGVDKSEFEADFKNYVARMVKTLAPARPTPPRMRSVEELEADVAADPDDADAAALLAESYIKRDNAPEARRLVDRILVVEPTHPIANSIKAMLFMRAGDTEAAAVILERARKANPDNARILQELGRIYIEDQEYDKAIEIYEYGRAHLPLDADWLQPLIILYSSTMMTIELISVLKDKMMSDPDELDARIKLAQSCYEEKQYAESEQYAREALQINIKNYEAQDLLIDALKAQEKVAEAERIAKRFATN